MKKLLFAVVAAFGLCLPGYAGTITVESGSEYELTAADNISGNIIYAQSGATIKLLFDEGTTEFKFLPKLKCDGGKVTVTADSVLENLYMRGGLLTVNDGVIDVAAAKKLIFGSAHAPTYDTEKDDNALNYQLFNATVTMTATDADGIVLTNRVTAKKIDVNCPVSIADNAWIAIWSDDVLPVLGIVEDTLTLDGWNATVLGENVLENKNIVVNNGMVLALLPCAASGDWNWTTQHYSSRTFKCNVALNGQDSILSVFGAGGITFTGDITGIGNLEIQREAAYLEGERSKFEIDGKCTFKGDVIISASNRVVFASPSPGDASNIIKITGDNPIIEFDEASEVIIAGIESTIDARLLVASGQQVNLGALKGRLSIVGDGVNSEGMVNIDTLDESSTLVMKSCVPVKIRTAGANTVYKVTEGASGGLMRVDLTDFTGDTVPTFDIADNINFEVLGNQPIVFIEPINRYENVTLNIGKDTDTSVTVGRGTKLNVDGAVAVKEEVSNAWINKVSNWFDASVTDSLEIKNLSGSNRYINWYDKNTGADGVYLKVINESVESCMPLPSEDKLNGYSYVSMGEQPNARRLLFSSAISPKQVIMVFGSQNGGGKSFFDGRVALQGVNGRIFDRDPTVDSRILATSGYNVRVDGLSVDATSTQLLDGGWQIITMDFTPGLIPEISALGYQAAYGESGGQNYAEVIFFDEPLNVRELLECEMYLAKKWGLKEKYKGEGYRHTLRADGSGAITVDADVDDFGGGFSGVLTVNSGKTLTLSANPPPPADDIVQDDGRIAWFDPNYEGALKFGYKNNNINHLYNRSRNGLENAAGEYYLDGSARPPTLLEREGTDGSSLKWIDFTNDQYKVAAGWDVKANTMRSKFMGGDAVVAISNVVQAFIVVDSSRGGGNIMCDDIYFNNAPGGRKNDGTVASDPIWEKRTGAFADVTTYLDYRKLSATDGFTGKPEVLTVEFNGTAYNPAFFGSITASNYEILGEMLFYSKKLSDETRTGITAYLARKWFGEVLNGYSDLSSMTLAGEGTVVVPAGAALPMISEDFTGNLVMEANNYEFTIDTSVSANSAINAMSLNCSLTLPNDCTITLKPGAIVQPGEYKLVSAQSITAGGNVSLRFSGDYDWARFNPRLVIENNSVVLKLSATGTVIIVR